MYGGAAVDSANNRVPVGTDYAYQCDPDYKLSSDEDADKFAATCNSNNSFSGSDSDSCVNSKTCSGPPAKKDSGGVTLRAADDAGAAVGGGRQNGETFE